MKKTILILFTGILLSHILIAQNKLFETFPDSITLNNKADIFIKEFIKEVNDINPAIHFPNLKTAYNVMGPFFWFKNNTMNLPVWSLSPQWYKDFCINMAGNEEAGKEMFGLFFNGFYIPHELGHAIQFSLQITTYKYDSSEYEHEYQANIIAMLYWKKHGKNKELKKCYDYAKQALTKLKSPVPLGEDIYKYFSQHYEDLTQDINGYAYFQFTQYVQVYEAINTFPDFKHYIKNIH